MLLTRAAKFAIATALIATTAVAQDPTILRESSSAPSQVPMFSAMGSSQCDSDGNLYFNTSLDPRDSGLLKIAHDGAKFRLYKLPANDADTKYVFGQFNVTPSGDLGVLAYGNDHAIYIFRFDSDLGSTSKTRLELPDHVRVNSFAAFESGTLLVTGYFNRAAEPQVQGKIYTAIFEASGKLRAVVKGHFADFDFASIGKKLPEGGAAIGEDGFLYLLRPNEVVVISESGTIVRRMPFNKPSPELIASRIDVSGGLIDIELLKNQGLGKELKAQFLVLNASTGKRVGLYQPEPALGNNFTCFTRSEGFTFTIIRDDKFTILTAPLR
jgi:hypothetical protein